MIPNGFHRLWFNLQLSLFFKLFLSLLYLCFKTFLEVARIIKDTLHCFQFSAKKRKKINTLNFFFIYREIILYLYHSISCSRYLQFRCLFAGPLFQCNRYSTIVFWTQSFSLVPLLPYKNFKVPRSHSFVCMIVVTKNLKLKLN